MAHGWTQKKAKNTKINACMLYLSTIHYYVVTVECCQCVTILTCLIIRQQSVNRCTLFSWIPSQYIASTVHVFLWCFCILWYYVEHWERYKCKSHILTGLVPKVTIFDIWFNHRSMGHRSTGHMIHDPCDPDLLSHLTLDPLTYCQLCMAGDGIFYEIT